MNCSRATIQPMIEYNPQDFYRSLKALDAQYRGDFNHDEIPDAQYLNIALKEEIVSSALSVLLNDEYGNLGSMGVDANCREILESLALLKRLAEGKITPDACKRFRHQYFLVEYFNEKHILVYPEDAPMSKKETKAKVQELVDGYCAKLNCSEKDLPGFVRDPLFFLSEPGHPVPGFLELIKQELTEESVQAYTFFSIREHPHYTAEVPDILQPLRNRYLKETLEAAFYFFEKEGDIAKHDEIRGLDEEERDLLYAGQLQFMQNKVVKTQKLIDAVTSSPEGRIVFVQDYLEQALSLYVDMRINLTFGFAEQALIKLKPFLELSAVFQRIEDAPDAATSNLLVRAYETSTSGSYGMFLEKATHRDDYDDEELPKLYQEYYRDAYHLDDYAKFREKFLRKSLYFLDQNPPSYNQLVESFLSGLGSSEREATFDLALYESSKDLGHGGGYLFDSSDCVWTSFGPQAVVFLNRYLLFFFYLYDLNTAKATGHSSIEALLSSFKADCATEEYYFHAIPVHKVD